MLELNVKRNKSAHINVNVKLIHLRARIILYSINRQWTFENVKTDRLQAVVLQCAIVSNRIDSVHCRLLRSCVVYKFWLLNTAWTIMLLCTA